MVRFLLSASLALAIAAPLRAADDKEFICGNVASVVSAIQAARLDRVSERDVREKILASDPAWPDRFDNAIVHMTPWVYDQKMRDVRKKDLGAAFREICAQNWQSIAHLYN